MPRVPRYLQWSEEACFHLMNRGHNREPVFADDEDRRAFVELVARYRDRVGFRLQGGFAVSSFVFCFCSA